MKQHTTHIGNMQMHSIVGTLAPCINQFNDVNRRYMEKSGKICFCCQIFVTNVFFQAILDDRWALRRPCTHTITLKRNKLLWVAKIKHRDREPFDRSRRQSGHPFYLHRFPMLLNPENQPLCIKINFFSLFGHTRMRVIRLRNSDSAVVGEFVTVVCRFSILMNGPKPPKSKRLKLYNRFLCNGRE